MQLRQDLARLLRRLRAVRRQHRPYDQLQWQIHRALAEARRLGPLLTLSDAPEAANPMYPSACPLSAHASGREEDAATGNAAADFA